MIANNKILIYNNNNNNNNNNINLEQKLVTRIEEISSQRHYRSL